MAPSNLFIVWAQVRVLIGGGFSSKTVNRQLVYNFGPFEGTARDDLTLPVLSIRPCSVEGLKWLERSRYGSPRRRPSAKFSFGWGCGRGVGRAYCLSRRRLSHSAIYPFYDQLVVSIDHILLNCVLARQVKGVCLRMWSKED
jgi:hypothetical protein